MPADAARAEALARAAAALGDATAVIAFLDQACKGDGDLRRAVEERLCAPPETGAYVPRATPNSPAPPPRESPTTPSAGAGVGSIVAGRYKLLQEIGHGGMGSVFMAQQLHPVKRLVALKLIKPGMDSKAVLARFEAERQALALMDHPHIAKVLDGGTTESGVPYFAMELVRGTPITQFCDERKLAPADRIRLFTDVCHAVQHAHQKGIIHRDLKPTNVLVELHDDKPVAKVIDFGVAKAVGQQLTEHTLFTGFGAVVGTPAYMSPEQANFNALDVDTRSDVYSLGVLLYELLAGAPPFDPQQLKHAAFDEALRIVREQEPPKPSTKLTSSEKKASIAATRKMEPAKLGALLRGDLDWIVMKCLEKDRTRRYETANGLALDLQRYLADEPVSAGRPSAAYRLRKYLRKNRGPALAAAAIFLALLAGLVAALWGLAQARDAAQQAQAERDDKERARAMAEEARGAEAKARRDAEDRAIQIAIMENLPLLRDDVTDPVHARALLALVRTLRTLPPGDNPWRDLLKAAILLHGQYWCPLTEAAVAARLDASSMSLSADGKLLLARDEAGARVWELPTCRLLATMKPAEGKFVAAAFADAKAIFATLSTEQGATELWDIASGRRRCVLPKPPGEVDAILVSPDGERLVTLGESYPRGEGVYFGGNRLLRLWDGAAGQLLRSLEQPPLMVKQVRLDPQGARLYAEFSDRSVRVLDLREGQPLKTLNGFPAPLHSFALSPSGRQLCLRLGPVVRLVDSATWKNVDVNVEDLDAYKDPTSSASPAYEAEELIRLDANHYLQRGNRIRSPSSWTMIQGDWAVDNDGSLHEFPNGKLLPPPANRRYHPDLARFAQGSRFLKVGDQLLDLRTELAIRFPWSKDSVTASVGTDPTLTLQSGDELAFLPRGFSQLSEEELGAWAELAVCGELDDNNEFRRWEEEAWTARREAFLRRPRQALPFAFPGVAASDPLFWLRAEIQGLAPDDVRRPALLERLRKSAPRDPLLAAAAPDKSDPRYLAELEKRIAEAPTMEAYHDRTAYLCAKEDYVGAIRNALAAAERFGPGYLKRYPREGIANPLAKKAGLPPEHYELAWLYINKVDEAYGELDLETRGLLIRHLARLEGESPKLLASLRAAEQKDDHWLRFRALDLPLAVLFDRAAASAYAARLQEAQRTLLLAALFQAQAGQHKEARAKLQRVRRFIALWPQIKSQFGSDTEPVDAELLARVEGLLRVKKEP